MATAGLVAGRHTFNALVEAHAAAGDVMAAKNMYDTMMDRGIKADHCTFIALFMVRTKLATEEEEEEEFYMLQPVYKAERRYVVHDT